MEKTFVSWEEVEDFVKQLCENYRDTNFTGVYGIPRGGCVLAVMISHALNIPFLASPFPGCLVVDDISDSGITLQHFRECGYKIATMYFHGQTKVIPDFSICEKKDCWIVFPWEMEK